MTILLSDSSGGTCLRCGSRCHRRRVRCVPCGNASKMIPPVDRFWKRVNKTPTCWLWEGAKTLHGYGHFYLEGKMVYSHRFSYRITKGEIPKNLCLDHLCRTPACVNPEHLEAVTQAENMYRSMMPNFITRRRNHDTSASV